MLKYYFALTSLMVMLAGCTLTQTTTSTEPLADADASYAPTIFIKEWAVEHNFNGVIAVKDDKGRQALYVNGVADKETGRLLTADSVFQTGSVDKFFATIAVFSLIEKNVLDLDAPISTYLPNYRSDTGNQITLAHLMSNRSGLPDDYRRVMGDMLQAMQDAPTMTAFPLSIEDGIKLYGSGDLKFKPDAAFDYVNVNWVLVRHILEKVTDKPYGKVLETHVFSPAGMRHSGAFVWDLHNATLRETDTAIGFNQNGKMLLTDWPLPAFVGGGTYTTANDMLKLMTALYDGLLLDDQSLKGFSVITTENESYAFGGRIIHFEEDARQLYSSQSGSNGATNLVAVHKIGTGYTFVALSNFAHEQDDMFELSSQVEKLISPK